jgi:hypothetical protein
MEINFSKKYFVTHSHNDEEAYALLIKKLRNRGMEPFEFPPIKSHPENMDCTSLIEAILDHIALVYIQNEYSDHTFWVAFQRDYALRAHKQVYSFDPVAFKIDKSRVPPLKLPIFPSYYSLDKDRLHDLFTFMRNRHIDLNSLITIPDSSKKSFTESFNAVVRNGGYYLIFISSKTLKMNSVKEELGFAFSSHPERILVGLLDNIDRKDIPGNTENLQLIQLFGDKKQSQEHRWDDLIVNLYWLVLKKTHILFT